MRVCVCACVCACVCVCVSVSVCRYVVPGTGPSVVLSRHILSDGSRWPVSDGVAQLLTGAGVSRVIVGHTPSARPLPSPTGLLPILNTEKPSCRSRQLPVGHTLTASGL